jgi:hypothetical protein
MSVNDVTNADTTAVTTFIMTIFGDFGSLYVNMEQTKTPKHPEKMPRRKDLDTIKTIVRHVRKIISYI